MPDGYNLGNAKQDSDGHIHITILRADDPRLLVEAWIFACTEAWDDTRYEIYAEKVAELLMNRRLTKGKISTDLTTRIERLSAEKHAPIDIDDLERLSRLEQHE